MRTSGEVLQAQKKMCNGLWQGSAWGGRQNEARVPEGHEWRPQLSARHLSAGCGGAGNFYEGQSLAPGAADKATVLCGSHLCISRHSPEPASQLDTCRTKQQFGHLFQRIPPASEGQCVPGTTTQPSRMTRSRRDICFYPPDPMPHVPTPESMWHHP